ncbi:MAG: hypothetical protein ACREDZ_05445 [Kiloniellales bacterium]
MTSAAAIPSHGSLSGSSQRHRFLILIAHIMALTVNLLPLLVVDIPAIVDYPNHLARMHILSNLAGSPELQSIYRIDWAPVPNLVMDLFVPPIAQLIGLELAGKVFVAATLVSVASGTVLLHRVVHGYLSYWPLAIYLFLYNGVLTYGFLNYLLGIGLCLILLAVWIAPRHRQARWRIPLIVIGTLALYFSHLLAFATFALCISSFEFWCWYQDERRRASDLLRAGAITALPFILPVISFVLFTPPPQSGPNIRYDLMTGKLAAMLTPANLIYQPADILLVAFAIILLCVGLWRRWFRFAPALAFPTAAVAASILLVPTWLYDNWGNDMRLSIPLVALLIAAMRLTCPLRHAAAIGTVALTLLVGRNANLAVDWVFHDSLYSEFRVAAATMPNQARVFMAMDREAATRPGTERYFRRALYHLVTLAVLERAVFVPTLFTGKGRQILAVQPEFEKLDVPHSRPMSRARLVRLADPKFDESEIDWSKDVYHHRRFIGWPRHYDYLLMLDFGKHTNPLPEILRPVSTGSYFTLYTIEHRG